MYGESKTNDAVLHVPVLLSEVLESFKNVKYWILDLTIGRGGHFFELLKFHNNLIGFDADIDCVNYIRSTLVNLGYISYKKIDKKIEILKKGENKKVILVNANFVELKNVLSELRVEKVSGILADLGINMIQLKNSKRGFSFKNKTDILDMRLNTKKGFRALDLLNGLSKNELTLLLKNLGEVRGASRIAENIINYRKYKSINSVEDLLKASKIDKFYNKKNIHPATQLFMALRIAVNKEHINLKVLLDSTLEYIKKGAVFSIITFHSLEEKVVYKFLKNEALNYEVYTANEKELRTNKSSRSAKLFVIKI